MTRKLALSFLIAVLGVLIWAPFATAQDATSGAIQGVVRDKATGESLIGVTVIATSPALQGTQTAITDASGRFKINNLPPGTYLVTFYYAKATVQRPTVEVQVNKTTPVYTNIDLNAAGGEVIVIEDKAPAIDPTSTSQGITIDQDYTKNMPVGRTFESVLGAAAGASDDALGVSFSGSTSLENTYVVDGVNTTDLNFGTVGTAVINDFIQEIEVITGGYQAEYGRATGGVVNVVTKSGSNDLHGSVFGYLQPGALVADSKFAPTEGTSIDAVSNLDYRTNVGFDLGGPIIKDKVWFYVGFAPRFDATTITRITKRRTDCRKIVDGELTTPANKNCTRPAIDAYSDNLPDIDPDTGFYIYEQLDSAKLHEHTRSYQWVSKLNYAVTPEHQGQITFQGTPQNGTDMGVLGVPSAVSSDFSGLTTDLATKWTSKFNNNKTEVDVVLGWHRSTFQADSIDDSVNDTPLQVLLYGDLATWGGGGRESMATVAGCQDGGGDAYPGIANCPDEGFGYAIGGPGAIADSNAQRFSARLSATQRFKALGHHEVKGGLDVEQNLLTKPRGYTGGALYQLDLRGAYYVFRYVDLAPGLAATPGYEDACYLDLDPSVPGTESYPCNYIDRGETGSLVEGNTFNWAAYLQDSWAILPNLTLNAGVRYEEQRLRYAKYLRDEFGTNAMELTNMWAPRVGVIYDWTKEGRSKIYGSWGRFYESIPMQINDRAFGGEASYRAVYNPSGLGGQCGAENVDDHIGGPSGLGCTGKPQLDAQILGTGVLIAPDIGAQYLDEVIIGGEYELMDDLKIGVSYQNRRLGRVIEDVSLDGADTYILANPGEFSDDAEADLQAQIDALPAGSEERAALESQLAQYRGLRIFDQPRRDYHALQLVLTKRFSKDLFAQVSYTYARSLGNYPGLFSPDNGQVDPNISSQYDLLELLANRDGALPQDRPHQFRIDAYRIWDLDNIGRVTTGSRIRLLSGQPVDALSRHYLYGSGESFLLPRGTMGRTDINYNLDFHLAYQREVADNIKVEVFADFFNLLNLQDVFGVDENYTFDAVNPVVGGDYSDLVFAKQADRSSGEQTGTPVTRNPNFLNPRLRYPPFFARFGARMTF